MRIEDILKRMCIGGVAIAATLGVVSCAGDQRQEEDVVEAEKGGDNEAVEGTGNTMSDESSDLLSDAAYDRGGEDGGDDMMMLDETMDDGGSDDMSSTVDAMDTGAPQQTGSAPATTNRVLRYVKSNGANIHAEPTDRARTVRTLRKGDRILVEEIGAWAKLSEGMYVKTDNLSQKAVAPDRRNAVWRNPPRR